MSQPEAIYLDHAATTPLRTEVREAMAPVLEGVFGNPSSTHRWGREASAKLEEARSRVADVLGARSREIHFTRGGTESDNLAILGRAEAVRRRGGTPLVAHSALEHHAVLEAAEAVEAAEGRRAVLPVDRRGAPDPKALDELLEEEPAVVSVMWVNNEVGTVLPVLDIAERCAERGVPFHSDGVQAVGKVDVRVDRVPVDLLTLTGHKIYGPKGTGILFVREGTPLAPLLHGGGQERGIRPGTQDVAGAVGMAEALILAVEERDAEAARLAGLRDHLEALLRGSIPELRVHGEEGLRAPHVSNVGIPGVDQETLLMALDMDGVAVSSGSACTSGAAGRTASHVLRALLGAEVEGMATLRFSLGRRTTREEVEEAARRTAVVVERIASSRAGAG